MASPPDLATTRALEVMRELNIKSSDADTLRRVRRFIQINGYEGVRRAAVITKNRSLNRARRGQPSITDRWGYCRQVYNRATGYACWAFMLLNLVEVSLRAWVDDVLAGRHGTDWHQHLARLFSVELIARIEDELARPPQRLTLASLATGAELLDSIELGTLRRLIEEGYGAAPRKAGLLLPSLPSDRTSGPHMELKQLMATLSRVNRARNDVMHHRLLTTPSFTKFIKDLKELLERRGFDLERALERVETGRLRALDDVPAWLREPSQRALVAQIRAPVRRR